MAFVILRDGETGDSLIARFRSQVTQSRLLKDIKERRFFRSKGEKKREAARRSARRYRRQARRHSGPG